MKKFLILILCVGVMSVASAQKFGFRGGYYAPHFSYGYGFYPYWGYGYPYYGYPYYAYPYGYGRMSYRLEIQEENIRYDYQQKIDTVRNDKTITGKIRRQRIRALREQRNQAINDQERNYYRY